MNLLAISWYQIFHEPMHYISKLNFVAHGVKFGVFAPMLTPLSSLSTPQSPTTTIGQFEYTRIIYFSQHICLHNSIPFFLLPLQLLLRIQWQLLLTRNWRHNGIPTCYLELAEIALTNQHIPLLPTLTDTLLSTELETSMPW